MSTIEKKNDAIDLARYKQAAEEIEAGSRDEALWYKAFSEGDGDENSAKAAYIRLRVEQLRRDALLAKNTQNGKTSDSNTDTSAPPSRRDLYQAYVGKKKQGYYLEKFTQFDRQGEGWHVSWNWWACIGNNMWALYRKMYGWFFALLIINSITGVISDVLIKADFLLIGIAVLTTPAIAFGLFANVLYYRKVKKEIATSQRLALDDNDLIAWLREKGGVHAWVIWAFWAIFIIGIIAAIAIPAYSDYTKKAKVQASGNVPQAAQETTLSSRQGVSLDQDATSIKEASPIGQTIHVKTDIFEVEISAIGGDISRLALLKHPDTQDKSKPLVLFHRGEGTHNYVAQSGLLGAGLPNHNTLFVAEQDNYELSGDADQLQVRLKTESDSALKVTKVITFHKGSYLVDVAYQLENAGAQAVTAASYFQLIRDSAALADSSMSTPTNVSAAIYTDKGKLQKVGFQAIENGKTNYPEQTNDGWIGILQKNFVAAWLHNEKTSREYFMRKLDGDLYSVGVVLPGQVINPSQKALVEARLYVGPVQADLDKIAPGLGLTVN